MKPFLSPYTMPMTRARPWRPQGSEPTSCRSRSASVTMTPCWPAAAFQPPAPFAWWPGFRSAAMPPPARVILRVTAKLCQLEKTCMPKFSSTGFCKWPAAGLAGLALSAIFLGAASAAAADELDLAAQKNRALWVVELENDIVTNEDRYYTAGTSVSRIGHASQAPDWLKSLAAWMPGIEMDDNYPYRLSINYNLYAPRDIANATPPPADRPYAAWINVQFSACKHWDTSANRMHVCLCMTVPAVIACACQQSL